MSWDDSDEEWGNLEPIKSSLEKKPSFNFNEEEEIVDLSEPKPKSKPKPKINIGFKCSENPDRISIYCTGTNIGNKRKGRKLIGYVLINHKGEILEEKAIFIGTYLENKEILSYKMVTTSINEAKRKGYTQADIYTDLTFPIVKEYGFLDESYKKDLYYAIKSFGEYSFYSIPKKNNWYVLNVINNEVNNIKKSNSNNIKNSRIAKKNLKAFLSSRVKD